MTRKITTVLLVALLFPLASVAAQNGERPSRRGESANTPPEVGQQQFLGAFQVIRDYSLSPQADSSLWRDAMEGLIEGLNDPYAAVLSPRAVDEFREETTGNYAGIGVQITQLNERITVTAVFRKTPAEMAGVQVGDVIVGVDGETTEGWTTGDASARIRGRPGTVVNVSMEREGFATPIAHPIERAQVHISSVTADYVDDRIGYIHLDRVARNSTAEVDSAFSVLADADGIILDLRRNPGGYLDESLTLADLFLERNQLIATTRGRNPRQASGEQEESGFARAPARIPDKSVVVLVDRFTASAAEIVAGALQDHDRALVLGERTFGKGVVQTIVPLPEGWQIRLTTGEWYTPLGRSLHRPRDMEGRALPENPDSFPAFTTAEGRELKGGGGVFPDIEVADDTLKLVERQLLEEAVAAEFPLPLRLAEVGFSVAQEVQDGTGPADITDDVLNAFIEQLRAVGVSDASLDDPVARSYVDWRLEVALSQRMNDDARALRFRAQRDSVLQEAIDLLRASESQAELFALAASRSSNGSASSGPNGHD